MLVISKQQIYKEIIIKIKACFLFNATETGFSNTKFKCVLKNPLYGKFMNTAQNFKYSNSKVFKKTFILIIFFLPTPQIQIKKKDIVKHKWSVQCT